MSGCNPTDRTVNAILVLAAAFIGLAIVVLIVACVLAAVGLFIVLPHLLATPTPTPAPTATPQPAIAVQYWPPAGEENKTMHYVTGRAFDSNQYTVQITTDNGESIWAPTGADGSFEAHIRSNAAAYSVSVRYNQGGEFAYIDDTMRPFAPNGRDYVYIDHSNI